MVRSGMGRVEWAIAAQNLEDIIENCHDVIFSREILREGFYSGAWGDSALKPNRHQVAQLNIVNRMAHVHSYRKLYE
jgi:hypothetical protein